MKVTTNIICDRAYNIPPKFKLDMHGHLMNYLKAWGTPKTIKFDNGEYFMSAAYAPQKNFIIPGDVWTGNIDPDQIFYAYYLNSALDAGDCFIVRIELTDVTTYARI